VLVNDFRRHRATCPHGRPAGTRRLDIAPDNGAFPVWTWGTLPATPGRPGREVHGCAGPGFLGISDDLAAELQAWSDWHDRHGQEAWRDAAGVAAEPAAESEWQSWRERGRILARRLAAETGDEVVYCWPAEGRDNLCPHCGPARFGPGG
jgi:hypothetical protein